MAERASSKKTASREPERTKVMRTILARAVTDEQFARDLTTNARACLEETGFAEQLGEPGVEFFETLRLSDIQDISLSDLDAGTLSWRFTLAASIQWD